MIANAAAYGVFQLTSLALGKLDSLITMLDNSQRANQAVLLLWANAAFYLIEMVLSINSILLLNDITEGSYDEAAVELNDLLQAFFPSPTLACTL